MKEIELESYLELIYQGRVFSIEAWKPTVNKCLATDWLDKRSQKDQTKFAALFVRMGDHGKIFNEQKFKHLTDTQLFEFKVNDARLISFFVIGSRLIITHGFAKKARKTPKTEIIRAELIRDEILQRLENDKN